LTPGSFADRTWGFPGREERKVAVKRSSLIDLLRRIHRDQQGATMVEWVLIIAAIVVPFLGVVIYYSGEIRDWLGSQWGEIRDDTNTQYDSNNP
jgi:Flp pilus assembly pilin Flp